MNENMISSFDMAAMFDKNNTHIMMDALRLLSKFKKLGIEDTWYTMFKDSSVKKGRRVIPIYMINHDGFLLLVMEFTGEKALEFKLKLLDRVKDIDFIN